jgi:hypothetical protein
MATNIGQLLQQGLLTGVGSTQQPVQQAVPGSPNFYGEFMAARGRGLQQGLGGLMRGGAPSTQERIQGAMFELSSPTAGGAAKDTATRIADLTKLARVQQVQGNSAAAAQTAAQVQQLKEQATALESQKERQGNFLKFLTERHPDLLSLASGDNPVVTPENYKQYLKVDGTKLTDDQKEYAQARNEGYSGTFIQYLDRNSKIGGANLTSEQRHLAQINQENKAKGLPEMSLSTFLEKKSATTGNLPDKFRIYNEAVKQGFVGTYLDFQQAEAKATRAPSKDDKRATTQDKNGFLRYVDDKTLVFPEVAAQFEKDKQAEITKEAKKKESTLEYLRRANMTVLADNLENNIIDADKAMTLAEIDPRITTLANDHLQKSIDLGSQSSSAVDLLLSYNDLDFGTGKPAEVKRQVEAAFGVGDKNRLLSFAYAEGRIKESNILMPPGSVTEMEVKRSDATQPEITESPEVVRGYLYGKAKKNALGAAQENALQKWMINYQGNTAGFVDYWMGVINDPAKLQAIFDEAGIPPNENFKRRVISGSNI